MDSIGACSASLNILPTLATIISTLCAVEFLRRYTRNLPVGGGIPLVVEKVQLLPRVRLMISVLAFSTLVLFIRSVYRIIELASGWNGRIIQTEVYFNALDGG
ncbi:hypothetical protein DFH09DRAFT_1180415 [Mycena vulgaris]|nr:hypothetical protein DFH09DRAFT_1180415 [Mycena vulgaris]